MPRWRMFVGPPVAFSERGRMGLNGNVFRKTLTDIGLHEQWTMGVPLFGAGSANSFDYSRSSHIIYDPAEKPADRLRASTTSGLRVARLFTNARKR